MNKLQPLLPTDTWVTASWDEYIQAIATESKAKGYYYDGKLRIEMSPVGNDHASDHTIIMFAVNLFASIKGFDINGKDNCTYRKTGMQEAQPDASYYIGENVDAIPWGTTIIDLDIYLPPNLVIEVANTSLADDLGEKRRLYEELEVEEYWIVDVQNVRVMAFAITLRASCANENQGSRQITESQLLPGLAISVLEAALQRTRRMNQGEVGAWLLTQFQSTQ